MKALVLHLVFARRFWFLAAIQCGTRVVAKGIFVLHVSERMKTRRKIAVENFGEFRMISLSSRAAGTLETEFCARNLRLFQCRVTGTAFLCFQRVGPQITRHSVSSRRKRKSEQIAKAEGRLTRAQPAAMLEDSTGRIIFRCARRFAAESRSFPMRLKS